MISVLPTGPKIRGFKPGREDRFLRVSEVRGTISFRGEENTVAPKSRNFSARKNHFEV
jgi:hypothetical protein